MRNLSVLLLCCLFVSGAFAQNTENGKQNTVFDKISGIDSVSGGFIKFYHDPRIERAVENNASNQITTISGFRVQVFSSNEQKTAKEKAFRLESELKEVFPEVNIYVSYTSPSWKVRMGDFLSMDAAQNFKRSLLDIYPELKSDTYTVRDQVVPRKN